MSTISPSRLAAHAVLLRVFEDDAYADRATRAATEKLDDRDRALATQLAYGTVQRVRTLDYAIERLGKRPVSKLDPPVRAALRLGAYQLGFMDGVPRYAAVNESVELVRRARVERAVPFTNAVLRRVGEGVRELLDALPDRTPAEAALRHSYPDWIAEVLWRDLGAAGAIACLKAQNEPAETVVRRVRGDVAGEPTDVPCAIRVTRVDPDDVAAGRVWPQSRASQIVGLAAAGGPGDRILDLCAAPGGKATMLGGEVVAVEANEGRARDLERNVRQLRAGNVRVVHADGRALPPELTGFDRALVDAPCSGLGVLSARPDLRWRAEPLPGLQHELLAAAIDRVRPGGTVVYSVCTLNREEGEEIVEAAAATGRVEVDPTLGDEWPRFRHPDRPELLLTLPHVHHTSGFFIARLRTR
ncbi:MAG: transcription antitermination factor NusB [Gaiellales bacterium]